MATQEILVSSTNKSEGNINALLEALQQQNLVYNYNFLYFSNQTYVDTVREYGHPDGWVYEDTSSEGTIGFQDDCCLITTAADSKMTFKQALHEFPRWENKLLGQTVTAKVHLSLNEGNSILVSLSDGIGTSSQALIAAEDGDYVFEVQLEVNTSAQELYIAIENASNVAVIQISKIYANIGTVALENLPCIVKGVIGERKQYIATEVAPAEELSLCESALELSTNQTRLNSVINYRFGTGETNNLSLLPDVRGYFSRAWNNEADTDPDASTRKMLGDEENEGDFVGTGEKDAFKEHLHDLTFNTTSTVLGDSGTTGLLSTETSSTEKTGGNETRPINVAELYTIKWA